MSNNPYAAPSAVVAEVMQDGVDRDRIRRIAGGQRMMVLAVLGQFLASGVNAAVAVDSPIRLLAGLAAVACAVMAIVGAVRLTRALGSHIVTTILVAILMIVPLVNLITMLVLSMRATRALRKAGIRVGLLGAKVD
jgi:hypothetical protein